MSYGFDLLRLPSGIDRDTARRTIIDGYRNASSSEAEDDPGPIDAAKEQAKAVLSEALIASYPSLKPFQRNFARLAEELSIEEEEARRRYRHIELNDEAHTMQITLFDDTAGVSFSPEGSRTECKKQLQHLWECLKIMETTAGLSTFDPQLNQLLDLSADFDAVFKQTCSPIDEA